MSPRLLSPVPAALAALALAAPAAHAAEGWSAPDLLLAADGAVVPAAPAVAGGGLPVVGAASRARATLFAAPAGAGFAAGPVIAEGAVSALDVGSDAQGGRYAAWIADGRGRFAYAPPGGGFGGPEELGPATEIDLDVAPSGEAVIAIRIRIASNDHRIVAARRPAGGPVGEVRELLRSGGGADQPFAAIDDGGAAVVAWRNNTGRYRVQAALAPAGGAFGAPQFVSAADPAQQAVTPRAGFASAGVPVVVWSDGPSNRVLHARAEGGTWTAPEVLASGNDAAVAEEPGDGLAVSYDAGDTVAVSTAGADGRFGPPVVVGAGGGAQIAQAQIAIDSAGNAYVAWIDHPSAEIRLATRPAGGAFRSSGQLGWAVDSTASLRLAAGANATAVAAWRQGDQGLVASSHRPGQAGDPGPGPRPGTTGTGDFTAPRVRFLGRRTLRLRRRTRSLAIRVRSNEAATLRVASRLRIRGVSRRLRTRRARVRAGRATTIRIRIARRHLRSARRALAAGRRVRLVVSVLARDAGGNARPAGRTYVVRG